MKKTWMAALAAVVLAGLAGAVPGASSSTAAAGSERYIVVLAGVQGADGFASAGAHAATLAAVTAAGGTVANDLSKQIGVLVVESSASNFATALSSSALVTTVGKDKRFKGLPDGGPEQTADPLESLQWDMEQIRAPQAHNFQAGSRSVDVGILDSGVDGRHPDFVVDGKGSNVDCARGRNSVSFLPSGPGIGNPDPCTDNQFHGTHVAGTVAAQANGIGVVGVAPNVTIVPVKVCDASGYCYVSAVVDGLTYAGDIKLDVINMSFFVDDDAFQESTEFKCNADPQQHAFRTSVERAIKYARGRGVVPVAALGNSDEDLGNPSAADPNDCDVVPAETEGVIGVASLGADSEKAGYSNYGVPANDVAAPGGNGTTGDCTTTILSTLPGGTYGCIQGTSMASPHAAGVAALIVSQFGKLGRNGDVELSPDRVEEILERSAIDLGLTGYDTCFGNGRIDALRAIERDFSARYDAAAPFCPEYTE
jgi:lantibiotic leader peptide-processing serine protease